MIHSGWFRSTFLRLVKFPQIRDWWDLHSWGVPILQKGWILSPIVYFHFKSFKGQNSLSFIRFHVFYMIEEFFQIFRSSIKWRMGTQFLGGNQLFRTTGLFHSPFCTSFSKALRTQILRDSLGFNVYCMNQEYLSHCFEISTN